MVYSPDDIRQKLKETKNALRKQAEEMAETIDKGLILKADFDEGPIEFTLPGNPSDDLIDAVIELYSAKGWDVSRRGGTHQDTCNDLIFKFPARTR